MTWVISIANIWGWGCGWSWGWSWRWSWGRSWKLYSQSINQHFLKCYRNQLYRNRFSWCTVCPFLYESFLVLEHNSQCTYIPNSSFFLVDSCNHYFQILQSQQDLKRGLIYLQNTLLKPRFLFSKVCFSTNHASWNHA